MEKLLKVAPIGLLIACVVRILILGCDKSEAIVILALASLVFGMEKTIENQRLKDLDKNINNKINGLENTVNSLKEDLEDKKKEIDGIKGYVSSMKMMQGIKR